jgi:hypothetical protein
MLFMRTTWRATCLGLMVLGPLLTACGGDDDGASTKAAATSTAAEGSGVYGQPSDPDAGEPTEVATDSPAVPTTTPAPAKPSTARVSPQLTYFGWNEAIGGVDAGGIITSIVESGGTCTLILTKDGTEVAASSEAIDNVTSTSCGEMVVPGGELSPGSWRTVLSYESDTAQGVSDPVQVEVP